MPSKIRLVLDTNVIFSAVATPDGVCADLIECILSHPERFSVFYTPPIEAEYRDVLFRPKLTSRVAVETIEMILGAVLSFGQQTLSQPIDWVVYPDYQDKAFVEVAIYNDAILLTCNMKDFPFAGLQLAYPQEFLDFVADKL